MGVSLTQAWSVFVVLLGFGSVYVWLSFIDKYGYLFFLAAIAVSWAANIAVGAVETEQERERRGLRDVLIDCIKSVVGFFAYTTLATAVLIVAYYVFMAAGFLYAQFKGMLSGSIDAYERF